MLHVHITDRSDEIGAVALALWSKRYGLAVGLFLAITSLACPQLLGGQAIPTSTHQAECASESFDRPRLDALQEKRFQDAQRHYLNGLTFARAGNTGSAETELKAAVAISPAMGRYVRSLGLFYIDRGRVSEALAVIRNYVALCGANGLGYDLEAELLFKEKAFTGAFNAAAISLSYDQNNARMHELVGLIFLLRRDYSDGAFELSQAETLGPEDPQVRYFYGRALYNEGLYAEARDQFLACLHIQPGYRRATENLGLSYEAIGDLSDAARAYEEAINEEGRSGSKHGAPFGLYGAMLIGQGQLTAALSVLRNGVILAPNSFIVNFQLGRVLIALGKLDEAEKRLLVAKDLAPKFSRTYYLLGTICRKQKRFAEAKRYVAEFQELDKSIKSREFPMSSP